MEKVLEWNRPFSSIRPILFILNLYIYIIYVSTLVYFLRRLSFSERGAKRYNIYYLVMHGADEPSEQKQTQQSYVLANGHNKDQVLCARVNTHNKHSKTTHWSQQKLRWQKVRIVFEIVQFSHSRNYALVIAKSMIAKTTYCV